LSKITLHNRQRDLPLSLTHLRKAISFLLQNLKISTHEVIFHFVTESTICQIHEEFFQDPSPTDCITFPIDPPELKKPLHILGEAFICPKVALEYAQEHRLPPEQELMRYVVHCLLHLIGYTDTRTKERNKMKRKERLCLKKLAQKGLI
jgi:probable rRNA maturation factor